MVGVTYRELLKEFSQREVHALSRAVHSVRLPRMSVSLRTPQAVSGVLFTAWIVALAAAIVFFSAMLTFGWNPLWALPVLALLILLAVLTIRLSYWYDVEKRR